MNSMTDLVSLVSKCVSRLYSDGVAMFATSILVGLILAALGWLACSKFSHGFHKNFQVRIRHHVLCAIAALLTLLATIIFFAMKFTEDVALVIIDEWANEIEAEATVAESDVSKHYQEVFRDVYDEIFALRSDDGTQLESLTYLHIDPQTGQQETRKYIHPDEGGQLVPITMPESRLSWAEAYANGTVDFFKINHPFLAKMLWADEGVSTSLIQEDVDQFFVEDAKQAVLEKREPKPYPSTDAIDIAVTETEQRLVSKAPRIVMFSRISLAVLFAVAQAVPFGLIAWAAHRDLNLGR